MKNIFYIFIEHVEDTIPESIYDVAIIYPNLCTFIFGGNNITMFFDIFMAFENIFYRGGFNSFGYIEFDIKFY